MIDRTGSSSSSLARSAIESALKRQAQTLDAMQGKAAQLAPGADTSSASDTSAAAFSEILSSGLKEVDNSLRQADSVHLEVVNGKLDFHEVAAQLKESELGFQFAMQIRNKLIDAYREVMRMGV
ncbi:MAG: flagellar hook-basal body complex protein FliE [Chlamydiales bacterium]|jgi:flagellar hook-basal body complex protein FliE